VYACYEPLMVDWTGIEHYLNEVLAPLMNQGVGCNRGLQRLSIPRPQLAGLTFPSPGPVKALETFSAQEDELLLDIN